MPAGVVVVKRARRRSFALLWAALAWARSVASGLGWRAPASAPLESAPHVVRFPVLARDASGDTRCTACGDCVATCPALCLRVVGEADRATRFELDPGACIGCARCIDVCPEAALEAVSAPPVIATVGGRVEPIDLLDVEGRGTPIVLVDGAASTPIGGSLA